MTTVIVCARRDDNDWRDLYGCVQALHLYGGGLSVRVFWQGPVGPFLANAERQPDHCRTFGAAFGWATAQVPDGDVILCNDDCRIHPDTVDLALDDVAELQGRHENPGIVAAHSNFARKGQSLTTVAGTLPARLPVASPIFGWVAREALDVIVWPDCNWYSDDVICTDLAAAGFTCWVSRAYVDHFGERATRQHGETQRQLARAGQAWVREHRPELA